MTITPGTIELPEETIARWTAEAEGAIDAQRDEDTLLANCDHDWVTDDSGDSLPNGRIDHWTYCGSCGIEAGKHRPADD